MLTARQGNTQTLTFLYPVGTDLSTSTFFFYAKWKAGNLKVFGSPAITVNSGDRTVAVKLTAAQTKLMPTGENIKWELERRWDTEQKSVVGIMKVLEGINDDT